MGTGSPKREPSRIGTSALPVRNCSVVTGRRMTPSRDQRTLEGNPSGTAGTSATMGGRAPARPPGSFLLHPYTRRHPEDCHRAGTPNPGWEEGQAVGRGRESGGAETHASPPSLPRRPRQATTTRRSPVANRPGLEPYCFW
jgi:hypothetical protein